LLLIIIYNFFMVNVRFFQKLATAAIVTSFRGLREIVGWYAIVEGLLNAYLVDHISPKLRRLLHTNTSGIT